MTTVGSDIVTGAINRGPAARAVSAVGGGALRIFLIVVALVWLIPTFGLLVESLRAMGFARPEALLVGATALLPLVLLSSITVTRTEERGKWSALLPLAAVLVGVPIGLAPGSVHLIASAVVRP